MKTAVQIITALYVCVWSSFSLLWTVSDDVYAFTNAVVILAGDIACIGAGAFLLFIPWEMRK